jgi:hypothetical protein
MAKFMDVHDGFFGVSAQELADAHQRDLDIEGDEGVHYERAWLDPEAGKVFCLDLAQAGADGGPACRRPRDTI